MNMMIKVHIVDLTGIIYVCMFVTGEMQVLAVDNCPMITGMLRYLIQKPHTEVSKKKRSKKKPG